MGALELHIFKFTSLVCLLLVGDWGYIIREQFRFQLFEFVYSMTNLLGAHCEPGTVLCDHS